MLCCEFPSIRGVATSLPLALYGLSALFYSVIASVFYPGDTSNFWGFGNVNYFHLFDLFPSVYIADCEHKLKSASTFHKPSVTVNSTHHHPPNTDSQSISSLFTDVKFWLFSYNWNFGCHGSNVHLLCGIYGQSIGH